MKLTKMLLKIRIYQSVIELDMVIWFERRRRNFEFVVFLAVDAVKDKVNEKTAEASKEANKDAAHHEAKSLVETVKEKAAEAYAYFLFFCSQIEIVSIFSYNYVAGGEDGKGLVETVKEKAAEAYVFVDNWSFFLQCLIWWF